MLYTMPDLTHQLSCISFLPNYEMLPGKADNDILHQIHSKYATKSLANVFHNVLPVPDLSHVLFHDKPEMYSNDCGEIHIMLSHAFHLHEALLDIDLPATLVLPQMVSQE